MINTYETLEDIYDSTLSAELDGYHVEKILLSQNAYDAFKEENEKSLGEGNGDFDTLLVYPVRIDPEVDNCKVVIK